MKNFGYVTSDSTMVCLCIINKVVANDDACLVYVTVCRRVSRVRRCVLVSAPAGLDVEWEDYLRRSQRLEGVLQSPVLLEQQV